MNEFDKNVSEQIETAKQAAQSPLDLQAKLMSIVCQTIISSHSTLADALAPDEMMRDVVAFHEKFGINYDGPPRELPHDIATFRMQFLDEELREYMDAVASHDLEKQFDALIDLVYVALGTAHLQGFQFRRGWKRVQQANMAKVRANSENKSTRHATFDIVKPPCWVPPTLKDLL